MKLYWSPRSPYVRKVMIAAIEMGLDESIEKVRSLAALGAPNPILMMDNPLSKIPALVLATGECLFDSLTICEYLDFQGGAGRLFPAAGPERWRALTWHSLGDGLLDLLILWRNEREKPSDRQTPEWLDAFACKTEASLTRLEEWAPDFHVARFGIGQIAVGCALSYADFRFPAIEWRNGRPQLACFYHEFSARLSVIATDLTDA